MGRTQEDLRTPLTGAVRAGPDVRLRAGGPEDAGGLATLLRSLSAESAFLRFMTGLGEPKPSLLRGLLHTGSRRGAVLAVVGLDEVVGHACWFVDDAGVADVGVVVADAWQRRGIGRRLTQEVVGLSTAAGASSLHLDVHPLNRKVLTILSERTPAGSRRFDDGLVAFDVPLR